MAQDNILIIGAGTWGCSIALELARRGHTGITVLDGSDFASSTSAGNHRNMIAEEAPSFGTPICPQKTLHTLSHQKWRTDPLLSSFYHAIPLITATTASANSLPLTSRSPSDIPLASAPDFQTALPGGTFPGWRGFLRKTGAGWIDTQGAVTALREAAVKLGVRFLCEKEYVVTRLIYSTTSASLSGAVTASNTTHLASTIILAAGAYSTLLLDFSGQIIPRAVGVAYMSVSGANKTPLVNAVDTGSVIVDGKSGEVQITAMHPAYINPVANTSTYTYASVPFAKAQIPLEAEARMRALLSSALPHLADREFSHARLRWEAHGGVLVDKHPGLGNLVVAVGGGGELGPGVAGIVADLVEGREGVVGKGMRWRAEECEGRDIWEGGVVDIGDVKGWTRIGE